LPDSSILHLLYKAKQATKSGSRLNPAFFAAQGLSLALFVLGVNANDSHALFAADDFAMLTHFLDRSTNFHDV